MIKKVFGNYTCISCGDVTTVKFIIHSDNELITLPLCRNCSNMFAEDVINKLRQKNMDKAMKIRGLKKKVKQMNIKSHKHKQKITELYRSK